MHHMTWREDLDALRFCLHIFKVMLSSGLQRSLRSTGHRSWRISQPAPQSKLRELRQRARLLSMKSVCKSVCKFVRKKRNRLNISIELWRWADSIRYLVN